jgi:plasmid stabilization system protein ParE
VHVLYYRADEAGFIKILCVLHERMEPRRHPGEYDD